MGRIVGFVGIEEPHPARWEDVAGTRAGNVHLEATVLVGPARVRGGDARHASPMGGFRRVVGGGVGLEEAGVLGGSTRVACGANTSTVV